MKRNTLKLGYKLTRTLHVKYKCCWKICILNYASDKSEKQS